MEQAYPYFPRKSQHYPQTDKPINPSNPGNICILKKISTMFSMFYYRFTAISGHSIFLPRSVRLRWVGALPSALLLCGLAGCASSVPLQPTINAVPASGLTTAKSAPAVIELDNPAINARFTAPSVIYSTPGLQPGRTSFTSQAEIQHWLRDLANTQSHSAQIKVALLPIGQSQQGQALEALVLTRGTSTDPAALKATKLPTVLLISQQHGDEPAGTEALLIIARELAQGLLEPLLDQVNVVIVARANPDGVTLNQHVTASGLDLNQDHLLLNTPEARALAKLTSAYQPVAVLYSDEYKVRNNLVEKFGAVPKFDVLFNYATNGNLPEFLTKAAEEWYRRPLLAALKSQGLTSEWIHSTSSDPADKKVAVGSTQPDTNPNTDGLKNIISLHIETRGSDLGRIDLQRRVHAHVTAITSVLGSTAQRVKELAQLRPYMDKDVSAQACKGDAVVTAAPTLAPYGLVMLEPLTGVDKTITVDWDSTLTLFTLKKRARPCGYWLAKSSKTAAERLELLGLKVLEIPRQSVLQGDMYLETTRPTDKAAQDARRIPSVATTPPLPVVTDVTLVRGVIDAPAGSYYIPLNQPLANLAIAALEPDTPSSYFSNQLIEGLASVARIMLEPSLQPEERRP